MVGFAHVVLHVALCNAIARQAPQTTIAMQVRLTGRIGRNAATQKVYRIERGDGNVSLIEFDAPRGDYRLQIAAPKYNCNALDYITLISEHNRSIAETLSSGAPPQTEPLLLSGTAPPSFLYAAPTFVMLDKNLPCKGPIDDTIPAHITVENDQDSYYEWMYSDPSIAARGSVQVALRLSTVTGEYHYIRIKVPFPQPWDGFPSSIGFNIEEQDLDAMAGEQTDVLLCPKLFRTSAG
ncbi:MAG: hypothetical protein M3R51_07560 [Candidatus Eremiobacteraeota bacterium]|nr:hypothetical protein [Candidatus Eremiobacteraeota bacterium]